MSLDLLDILLVTHFGFDVSYPWWMWVIGVLVSAGANLRAQSIDNSLKKLAERA